MNLYELTHEARTLAAFLEDFDVSEGFTQEVIERLPFSGVIDLELDDDEKLDVVIRAFADAERASAEKVERIGYLMRNLEVEAEACKEEASRFAARSSAAAKKIDRLKKYVAFCLDQMEVEKVQTRIGTFHFRNSTAVDDDTLNLDALPDDFVRIVRSADKKAISDAIKKGADVPGAALVTRRNLVWRKN